MYIESPNGFGTDKGSADNTAGWTASALRAEHVPRKTCRRTRTLRTPVKEGKQVNEVPPAPTEGGVGKHQQEVSKSGVTNRGTLRWTQVTSIYLERTTSSGNETERDWSTEGQSEVGGTYQDRTSVSIFIPSVKRPRCGNLIRSMVIKLSAIPRC